MNLSTIFGYIRQSIDVVKSALGIAKEVKAVSKEDSIDRDAARHGTAAGAAANRASKIGSK
jgi:hypothetical protein